MLSYVFQFLQGLTFSVVVEILVVFLLCFAFKKDKRIALVAGLGTLCTIPYVWFVFPTLFWYSSDHGIYLAESFAFLFEMVLYKIVGKLSWRYAFLFSLLANTISFFLGKLLL